VCSVRKKGKMEGRKEGKKGIKVVMNEKIDTQ
jgi:hypothetical protein